LHRALVVSQVSRLGDDPSVLAMLGFEEEYPSSILIRIITYDY
jgi:hypothetical protein